MNEREGGGGRNALAASLFSSGVFADSLLSLPFSLSAAPEQVQGKKEKTKQSRKSRQSKALKWNMGCGYVYQTTTNHSIKNIYIHLQQLQPQQQCGTTGYRVIVMIAKRETQKNTNGGAKQRETTNNLPPSKSSLDFGVVDILFIYRYVCSTRQHPR